MQTDQIVVMNYFLVVLFVFFIACCLVEKLVDRAIEKRKKSLAGYKRLNKKSNIYILHEKTEKINVA